MAKVSFNKLNLKINEDVKTLIWNEQEIEVKQYLPVEDKLNLIAKIVNESEDDNVFYNPCKLNIFSIINIIITYTNINFTDKILENIPKLYDSIISSGLVSEVYKVIPSSELQYIEDGIVSTIDEIYKYKNSIGGILSVIVENYDKLQFDAKEINETLSNPENLTLLKDVVTKLD